MMTTEKDPQQELEDMLSAQKLLEEQIKQQREVARQAALNTIKRLYESHAFEYKDVRDFIKATAARKTAARKPVAKRNKRST
jgi:hypothetical protein